MAIFKPILPSDIRSSTSNINQLIDIAQSDISGSGGTRKKYTHFLTGGVGPGITSSLYQTIYDQDYTLQSANQIFDITLGIHEGSSIATSASLGTDTNGKEIFPSSTVMMREKLDIYRQFAGMLLGDTSAQFVAPFDSTTTTDKINVGLFIAFKRIFTRDRIKPDTFAVKFFKGLSDTTLSPGETNLATTSENFPYIYTDNAITSSLVSAFGGTVANLIDATNVSSSVGLIFYERGILVLDLEKITSGSEIASGTIDAITSTGTTPFSASFIPNYIVSASMDNILDHITSCRFSLSASAAAMTFQNVTNVNSTYITCRAEMDEFNYSSNPTFVGTDNEIVVIDDEQDVNQKTYSFITSIGIYDANNNLIAVAKLSQPVKKTPETELNFRIRLD